MRLKAIFISVVIAAMLLFAPFIPTDVSAVGDELTVIAFSDFQHPDGNASGAATLNGILKAMAADGVSQIDGVFACGDYDVDTYGEEASTKEGINTLKNQFSLIVGEEKMLFVQGNHDAAVGTAKSGNNDSADGYGVFVINEDDYMWYNDDEPRIKKTADELRAYLDEKLDAEFDKPIFVLSHLPLHYSVRTRDSGDAQYANYIFDVLNSAGEKGLNIIFLFGHDHSGGYDDYLGGSSVYLPKGATVLIAENSKTEFKSHSLNFTYMNAGYVGYYSKVNGGANTNLSVTVFKINGNEVTVSRYDESGKCLLKASGVTNTYKNETGYAPDTTLYASPQIINQSSEKDSVTSQMSDDAEKKDDTVLADDGGKTAYLIIPILALLGIAAIITAVRRKK